MIAESRDYFNIGGGIVEDMADGDLRIHFHREKPQRFEIQIQVDPDKTPDVRMQMIAAIKDAAKTYPPANMAGLDLRHIFERADEDHNGFLTLQEVRILHQRKFHDVEGTLSTDPESSFYAIEKLLERQHQIIYPEFAALFRSVGLEMADQVRFFILV